jgi:hypothetical protein
MVSFSSSRSSFGVVTTTHPPGRSTRRSSASIGPSVSSYMCSIASSMNAPSTL